MGDLVAHFDVIVNQAPNVNLDPQQILELKSFIESNSGEMRNLDLSEQKTLLRLCMTNLDFFTVCLNKIGFFPNPFRFALVSKCMYSFGKCGAPSEILDSLDELMESEQRSWWDQYPDRMYSARELIVSNPSIGPEPLSDEFPNCPDLDLLHAMLSNPKLPKEFPQSILNRSHLVFDEYADEELEGLIDACKTLLEEGASGRPSD